MYIYHENESERDSVSGVGTRYCDVTHLPVIHDTTGTSLRKLEIKKKIVHWNRIVEKIELLKKYIFFLNRG